MQCLHLSLHSPSTSTDNDNSNIWIVYLPHLKSFSSSGISTYRLWFQHCLIGGLMSVRTSWFRSPQRSRFPYQWWEFLNWILHPLPLSIHVIFRENVSSVHSILSLVNACSLFSGDWLSIADQFWRSPFCLPTCLIPHERVIFDTLESSNFHKHHEATHISLKINLPDNSSSFLVHSLPIII